eukprot:859980-Pyramimonas_sp.AAC.1
MICLTEHQKGTPFSWQDARGTLRCLITEGFLRWRNAKGTLCSRKQSVRLMAGWKKSESFCGKVQCTVSLCGGVSAKGNRCVVDDHWIPCVEECKGNPFVA